MKKIKLSGFVLTRNEEKYVDTCLKSLDFCDEIVLVDAGSKDKTLKFAKKYTNRIYIDKDYGYCEPSRSLAAKKCKGEWLLNLDADETIPENLKKEILHAIKSDRYDAYMIPRDFYYMGRLMKHIIIDLQLRLHKKNAVKYTSEPHNGVHQLKNINMGLLKNSISHVNLSFKNHIKKVKHISKIQAKNEKYVKTKYFGIFYRPIGYFLYLFIYRKGFLDGFPGFVYSLVAAYHEIKVYFNIWFKNYYKN